MQRMIANFTAGYVRNKFVQQTHQHANQARLGLPRRPSKMKLWRDRTALTICGTTVSS
jgi:hypothetical protein